LGNLLFDEQPVLVDRTLATLIGLNEAIVLQQAHYWITVKKRKMENFLTSVHFPKGAFWFFNSYKEWRKNNFPFWSDSTIKRTIKKLEDMGILISTSEFNKRSYDDTKWYTIDYEALEQKILKELDKEWLNTPGGQNDYPSKLAEKHKEVDHQGWSNCTPPLVKMTKAIPEITSENKSSPTITSTINDSESEVISGGGESVSCI
jgi:hypothetical protein